MYFGEGEEPSLVGDRFAGPEFPQHFNGLGHAGAALAVRYAGKLPFGRKLAADSDAEDEAAFRQMVQRGGLFRHTRRMAHGQQIDRGSDGEAGREGSRIGQLHERIEDRRGEGQMVADPDRVEFQPVQECDRLAGKLRRRQAGHQAVTRPVVQRQAHRRCPS